LYKAPTKFEGDNLKTANENARTYKFRQDVIAIAEEVEE